ncbi:MAG TPA: glycosyltransferase family 4 protein [Acidimicrobiia bacterium]
MKVYWYWPYIRDELLALARAIPDTGDDEVVVHAMAGRLAGADTSGPGWRVAATLPAVAPRDEGSMRWAASRATTYLGQARARRTLLRDEPFDVAHVMFLNYFVDAFDLRAVGKRQPLVVSVHDVVPHQSRVPGTVERALLGRQYTAANTIVVHHESVRARLVAEFAVDPARVHNVPHWVIPAPAEPRARPSASPQILFFGALRRNKGVDVLLDAFAALPDRDLRLVVAGRGATDVEQEVRDAAARDPRVVAEIGFVAEARKHELFRASDLVVLPYTEFSSQSGVLHDAYAHHRPVVVTDVGALGESVRDDGSGWVVPARDAEALAETLTTALANGEAWTRAAAHAGSVGLDRSPDATARRLRAVYAAAAAHSPHAPQT